METNETNQIIAQMMGGDTKRFLEAHWRRRILVARDSLPELRSFYSVDQFIGDYLRTDFHDASLVIDIVDSRRRFTVPADSSAASQALRQGSSIALQALRLPVDLPGMPEKWRWMIELHAALCRYFLPGLPTARFLGSPISAVDVFCTVSASTTGGHHDTGDVFFLALEGEKEWTVEYQPDMSTVDNLYKAQLLSKMDLEPANETTTVVLSPGDCLYMPPYTYHRVRSNGPSLGVSFGLPAFNAIHLLAHKLSSLASRTEFIKPLPSAPENEHDAWAAARVEQRRQLRDLLEVLLKQNEAVG
jgi:ribosomal protein L16 Arg81 hydroxylase